MWAKIHFWAMFIEKLKPQDKAKVVIKNNTENSGKKVGHPTLPTAGFRWKQASLIKKY
jgi:hypothetical protein